MTVELPETVTAPVREGETAGRAIYTLNGEEIGSVAILYQANAEKAGYSDYLKLLWKKYLAGAAKDPESAAEAGTESAA